MTALTPYQARLLADLQAHGPATARALAIRLDWGADRVLPLLLKLQRKGRVRPRPITAAEALAEHWRTAWVWEAVT
jgi:sugar-specific transcriptional regulator TrmB